ncbi:MAG: hypothetical protein K0M69_16390 [Youngiibacter sp.]|nr:hypothetical protein [Youngiibacter sp.]
MVKSQIFIKKILKQLDYIGIDAANLLPELEYTAKHLKEKYGVIKVRNHGDMDDNSRSQISSRAALD